MTVAQASELVLNHPDVRLVPLGEADVDALHKLFLDTEVRRYLLDGLSMEREWVEQVVAESAAQFARDRSGLWGIRLSAAADPTELVGVVGLREFFEPPRMQLIFALSPRVWGSGLAVRASQRVLEYLFDRLTWSRVEAATDPPNVASIRVLERLGFERFVPDDPQLRRGDFGEPLFFELKTPAGA